MASATRKRQSKGERHVALSFIAVGDAPPTEFRIFTAGVNTTSKGDFLFDEAAARSVMADFQKHGADVMIDLEHLSAVDPDRSVNYDPDARGWCRLEVRNGELWAAGVSWTPDGVARLTDKRQRYISPFFAFDTKTMRITGILNIAIVGMPATDNLAPLVAASQRRLNLGEGEGDQIMTAEQMAQLAELLGMGADAPVEDVIATVAAMVKTINDAANGTSAEPASDAPPPEEQPAPMAAASRLAAASRVLVKLSGKTEISATITEIEAWKASHLKLETETVRLAKDRVIVESGERRRLVGELVKLGAETPATAWAEVDGVPDGKTPCERLAAEPIVGLRERVAKLGRAKGTPPPPPRTPTKDDKTGELTEREVALCAERKLDPAKYAATRAAIRAQSNHTQREGV